MIPRVPHAAFMPPSDADTLNARPAPPTKNGALSPLPSVSLSREHITEALAKSPDNGATLDLAHKSLTDVGEDGAEKLAIVGQRDDGDSDSSLVRCAYFSQSEENFTSAIYAESLWLTTV